MGLTTTASSKWETAAGSGAWRLVAVHAPEPTEQGTVRVLGTDALRIGRAGAGDLDLPLQDAEVSRRHATLKPHEDGWRIRDDGSRNGTFVDGHRIDETTVADGSVIRAGATLLLMQFVDLTALRAGESGTHSALLGDSVAMWRLRHDIATVAPSRVPVLVLGETGVGKELVAREIHDRSNREGAFVPVNCAGLPSNLVESELFGHAKGAFTGASAASRGLFGEADGGTLFLDEIGEMSLEVQAKLLRTLAAGEVRPVGETQPRTVDVRLVAATNVDLERAVHEGRFRSDLYGRLMGNTLEVPPLRARREDIPRLLQAFLGGRDVTRDVSTDVMEALLIHSWPYNVRELEQITRAAVTRLHASDAVRLEHLPAQLRQPLQARAPADTTSSSSSESELPLQLRIPRDRDPTPDELAEVLRHYSGNISSVASFYGKQRRQIYRWAQRLGIDLEQFRVE